MQDLQMMHELKKIAVSVIVAVYNRESLLPRCLDSLVYQTLDNIEIIVVDDFSTDNSWAVMEQWQARFPDKIRIMKSDRKGVVYTKNKGIRAARGMYISIVDSDDYVDYKMFKRMYDWAEKHLFPEMIHSPIISVSPDKKWNRGTMARHETIEDYLKLDAFFLTGKLWRRDLFERFGYLPEYQIGEDTSWAFPVISHLDHVSYCSTPSYYYELSPNSISLDKSDPKLVSDIVAGSKRIIEQTNPAYQDLANIYALMRVYTLSLSRRQYQSQTDAFLLENLHLLDDVPDVPQRLQKKIDELKNGTFSIPRTIYVNGFCTDGLTDALGECSKALDEPKNIVILDDNTCSMDDAPAVVRDAYAAGNMCFVAKYFALLKCYQNGGIYIDSAIEVDAPFDLLLNDPCFFGFESDKRFTDNVFGSCAGNRCVEQILKTYCYPELYSDAFAPLCERVATVLVGLGNTMLESGSKRNLELGFCYYPVEMFVCTLPETTETHVCHYRIFSDAKEKEMHIPQEVLVSLYRRRIRIETDKLNVNKLKKDRDFLKNKRDALQKKVDSMQKEVDSMQKEASDLQGKISSIGKDREWLRKQRRKLENELTAYKSSILVRVAWKSHCMLRRVRCKFSKK